MAASTSAHEAVLLLLLHGEALHGGDAGQHLAEATVNAAPAFEQRLIARGLAGGRPDADQRRRRQDEKNGPSEGTGKPSHHRSGNDDVDEGGKQIERQLREGGGDALHAAIEAGHRSAHALAAVVAERQRVQSTDGGVEQLALNAEPRAPPQPAAEGADDLAGHQQRRQRRCARDQGAGARVAPEPVHSSRMMSGSVAPIPATITESRWSRPGRGGGRVQTGRPYGPAPKRGGGREPARVLRVATSA